jgi:CelD/BcsL family acetyltransferase involved in cellulose biosynthesis
MPTASTSPSPDPSTGSVHVRVVDSAAELSALAEMWERLQQGAAITSVFASFEWQQRWWTFYGRGQALRLLVATSRGEIVGLLPLYIHTVPMLRYPVRQLRFVGTGGDTFPDDLGPILAAGREGEVARALAEAVMRLPGWDVLLLQDMDPACPFTGAITDEVRRHGLDHRRGRAERIAFMALPATHDAWLASLSRDRRYRVRNIRKKLVAAHPSARFFVWTDPTTLDEGVDRLVHLHRKRWDRAGSSSAFATPEYVGFHRAAMKALIARDRLRLYCLEVGGQIIAMYYFYRFRDRVYLMQSGFDPDFSDVKPGQVLLGHIVEHAIGEGHAVLDFLRGEHRYKDELATGERETLYLTAFRRRPGALVYRARREILPVVKRQLKGALARLREARAGGPDDATAPATADPPPDDQAKP